MLRHNPMQRVKRRRLKCSRAGGGGQPPGPEQRFPILFQLPPASVLNPLEKPFQVSFSLLSDKRWPAAIFCGGYANTNTRHSQEECAMTKQLHLFEPFGMDAELLRDPDFRRSVIRMLSRSAIPNLRHAAIVDDLQPLACEEPVKHSAMSESINHKDLGTEPKAS